MTRIQHYILAGNMVASAYTHNLAFTSEECQMITVQGHHPQLSEYDNGAA